MHDGRNLVPHAVGGLNGFCGLGPPDPWPASLAFEPKSGLATDADPR